MRLTYVISERPLNWADVEIKTPRNLGAVPNGGTIYVVGKLPFNPYETEQFYFECKARGIKVQRATVDGVPI